MIFAGDFAQLPPAVGREAAALYGRKHGEKGTTEWKQKAAIGKTLWHEVTNVIILRQNMRQTSMTPEDAKLRTALENMRYKACTRPSITDAEFRDVSVITTFNVVKDAINDLGSLRFSEETGQRLQYFYSEDTKAMKNQHGDGRQMRNIAKLRNIESLKLQNALWRQPCSSTNKLIPGRIGLCVGLPV
ncbi:hypothetical protein BKA70DRAFT_1035611, partial [Coprinopsis sp. MPI-PUGE-AT-0042]